MLLNWGVGENAWESLGLQEDENSYPKEISPEYSLEGLMLKLKLQYLCFLLNEGLIFITPEKEAFFAWLSHCPSPLWHYVSSLFFLESGPWLRMLALDFNSTYSSNMLHTDFKSLTFLTSFPLCWEINHVINKRTAKNHYTRISLKSQSGNGLYGTKSRSNNKKKSINLTNI